MNEPDKSKHRGCPERLKRLGCYMQVAGESGVLDVGLSRRSLGPVH